MSKNFRNRKRKHNKKLPARYTLLIMTAVCFVTMLLSLTLNISGGPLKTAAGYVFIPMQKGINSFGIHISDKVTEIRTLKNVKAENKKLKAEVEELTTQLTTTKLEQYELDNYRQLLDLDAKYPSYPKVAASVIAKDSGNWFSTFTIDKGKKDGVDVGMNVLAGSGLVGIVTDAGDNFAKVRCIIDDASKVSGMVSTTEDNLTVSGNIKTMNEDKVITFTELKDDDNKVKEGDPVVTSYVSDRYQQGILIGYVTKIENNSNNLTKSGTITPVVDFEHIENVMVITQLKQTGDTKTADDTVRSSMRRRIVLSIIITLCFLFQTTLFKTLSFANISPNLLIIAVSSFGFMRGKKEGLWVGFFCGLLIDIFCGNYIGLYALIYMYIGFINGLFQKRFYPDDIKLPMLLIGGSDLFYNLVVYFFMFLLRGRFSFLYYLKSIIIPEFVYTMVISILLYLAFLKVNQKLEAHEKRRAKKFDL